MTTSAAVLTGFIAWTLSLIVLMVVLRVRLVVNRSVRPDQFTPSNEGLPAFMQRLSRAHANCVENLPILGGLLIVALLTQQTHITDPLAPALLAARVAQSCAHLASGSNLAVNIRFSAFAVQLAIALYWSWALLTTLS